MPIYDPNDGCVYLTIYKGKLLPPYYLGSTYTKRILQENYHGTVSSREYKQIWKQEQKDHPELFETVIVLKDISRKKATKIEKQLQLACDAINSPFFINKSLADEKFTGSFAGFTHTEEAKRKTGIASKIRNTGKKKPPRTKEHTENWRISCKDKQVGFNNSNAKLIWILTPSGIIIHCNGTFIKYCKENNLPTWTMIKILQTQISPKRGRCIGYKCWYII